MRKHSWEYRYRVTGKTLVPLGHSDTLKTAITKAKWWAQHANGKFTVYDQRENVTIFLVKGEGHP